MTAPAMTDEQLTQMFEGQLREDELVLIKSPRPSGVHHRVFSSNGDFVILMCGRTASRNTLERDGREFPTCQQCKHASEAAS